MLWIRFISDSLIRVRSSSFNSLISLRSCASSAACCVWSASLSAAAREASDSFSALRVWMVLRRSLTRLETSSDRIVGEESDVEESDVEAWSSEPSIEFDGRAYGATRGWWLGVRFRC